MTEKTALLAQANYIGTTTEELAARKRGDRVAAGVDQKVLFPRRGAVMLYENALVLRNWGDSGDLILRAEHVSAVANEFTELYGRFIGGLLNAGKPLILGTSVVGEIYVMVNHKTFMETTDNRKWAKLIRTWLNSANDSR